MFCYIDPFSLIGVVFGLFITRTTFTIGSFLAIVGLSGVAVNNTLLMIDFMNVRLRQGRPLRDAVIEASAARLRPVLITTVTTMLGLLPMAIGFPNHSISWAPMATAFVAGLSSATVLALLITSVNYEFFEKTKAFIEKKCHIKIGGKHFDSSTDGGRPPQDATASGSVCLSFEAIIGRPFWVKSEKGSIMANWPEAEAVVEPHKATFLA